MSQSEMRTSGWHNEPHRKEYISLTVFGSDSSPIKKFIDDAIDYCMLKDRNKVKIYEYRWGCWRESQKKIPRSLESVVLDGSKKEEIVNDILEF